MFCEALRYSTTKIIGDKDISNKISTSVRRRRGGRAQIVGVIVPVRQVPVAGQVGGAQKRGSSQTARIGRSFQSDTGRSISYRRWTESTTA